MAGAAQAATVDAFIDGPTSVNPGEENDFTLTFSLPTLDPGYTYEMHDQYLEPGYYSSVGTISFGDGTSSKVLIPAYAGTYSYVFSRTFNSATTISFTGSIAYRSIYDYPEVTATFCPNTGCSFHYSNPLYLKLTASKSVPLFAAEPDTAVFQTAEAFVEAAVVPIAGTLPLLLSGLGLLGWFARRQRVATA
jgi:hypothetical protein